MLFAIPTCIQQNRNTFTPRQYDDKTLDQAMFLHIFAFDGGFHNLQRLISSK
jgi:hypothetical protein